MSFLHRLAMKYSIVTLALATSSLFFAAPAMAFIVANPAMAQTRTQTTQPRTTPTIQAPTLDPVMVRLNALQLEIDALRQSAGKQVVVLHFTPTELAPWANGNYNISQERSNSLCQQALGDRFGRVLSYRVQMSGDRTFFSHVVCETKP
ncbi:hypothetical protein [Altererythrobacter litoralis]|uniref:Uncharacterized protein n=1 Tax=Altererythrobacter litoralis TaxID=3113904 RepID=A0ABU7GBK7_9SPHN|nr:hypothetical protein [Erythrobacteraceae bacterium 1XM1-14]